MKVVSTCIPAYLRNQTIPQTLLVEAAIRAQTGTLAVMYLKGAIRHLDRVDIHPLDRVDIRHLDKEAMFLHLEEAIHQMLLVTLLQVKILN